MRNLKRMTMLLAFAVSLMMVIAVVPAAAKKPTAVPVAVSMDAQPIWVHEGADRLRYTVTLENITGADVSVTVEFTAATTTDPDRYVVIPANDTVTLDGFSRYASEFPETAGCHNRCQLPASVAIYIDGELVTEQTMSTLLDPDPLCNFDQASVEGVCIWTLPKIGGITQTGVWEITLSPTPRNSNRPVNATVTVRDGVPGNWCTIGDSRGIGGRWRDGDDDFVGYVYLPGDENLPTLDVGMCLDGGFAGEYAAVGNPDSFYLDSFDRDMTITVRWDRALP